MSKSTPPESDDSVPLERAIENGLAAVSKASAGFGAGGAPVTCSDIGDVFDTAIEHGAPTWNRGSQVGCARIYLHTAREIIKRLRGTESQTFRFFPGVNEVLDALQHIADRFASATPENANALGWAMRGIFDRFHVSRGTEAVNQVINAARAAGAMVDANLVQLCVTAAIAHGNVLFQAGALDACVVLHEQTARRVLQVLAESEKAGGALSPGLGRIRRELAPIVASHAPITDANAKMLAWKSYEAFQRILQLTPEENSRPVASAWHGFISYRRAAGSETALALGGYLKSRGLNAFIDVENLDSGVFGPRLLGAIEQAPNFLLILTPGCLDRCQHPEDWLRVEIAHAIKMDRNIIPILKDGFVFPDANSLPSDIRALPAYHAVTYSHEFFNAVIDRIEKYMRSAMDGGS